MHTQSSISTTARHLSHTGETFVRRQKVLADGGQFTDETAGVPLEAPIAAQAEEMEEDASRSGASQPNLHLTP